jgi:hypothetical protein
MQTGITQYYVTAQRIYSAMNKSQRSMQSVALIGLLLPPFTIAASAMNDEGKEGKTATITQPSNNIQKLLDEEENGTNTAPQPKFLQGRIEHSNKLAPLGSEYRTGATLNLAALKSGPSKNYWYQIPSWSAGTWEGKTETNISVEDLRSGYKDFQNDTQNWLIDGRRGFQTDRMGNIWQFDHGAFVSVGEADKYRGVMYVKSATPLEVNESQLVIKYDNVFFKVSKLTNKILKVLQRENIQTYRKEGYLLKVTASIKIFDEDGVAVAKGSTLSYETQLAPFAPINFYKGQDLRAMFKDFLVEHKLDDLIPSKQ